MGIQSGIFPALLTPFQGNRVDEPALRKAVEHNVRQGVSGFYVCGSTGEAFLLSVEERKEILEIVADQTAGRAAIIAHIGAIGTELTLELGRHAIGIRGVEAISSIPPFYYQFTPEEIVQFYLDLVEELDFPLIPYNFPKLSGVTLTPGIITRLRKNANIIGVKFTSNNFYDLERLKTSDPSLTVYNGFDEMYLAGLAMGVDGAIGSTFNFMADKFVSITENFRKGNLQEARQIQSRANGVIEALLKPRCFMAAEKYLMDCIGIPFGNPRQPFLPLNEEEKALLRKVADQELAAV